MIDAIRGKVVQTSLQGVLIETPSGLFYFVNTTSTTATNFLDKKGEEVFLYTFFRIREDEASLYGFEDQKTKEVFLSLLKVNGVGPKLAMKILAKIGSNELIDALNRADVGFLKTIPGLGAKTSGKIILELRDKLILSDEDDKKVSSSEYQDLLDSLTLMGYDKKRANTLIKELSLTYEEELSKMAKDQREAFLFKMALKELK